MSMGVFMPNPAPLVSSGGGGGGLDGMITVGSYAGLFFGWSDGSALPIFGSLSGDAASFFALGFYWSPSESIGAAGIIGDRTGAKLAFQGEVFIGSYDLGLELTLFNFGPEIATWPTSGTHPFTLTLP